jgi:hypothetical protein
VRGQVIFYLRSIHAAKSLSEVLLSVCGKCSWDVGGKIIIDVGDSEGNYLPGKYQPAEESVSSLIGL